MQEIQWNQYTAQKIFISDIGVPTLDDKSVSPPAYLKRYAVWKPNVKTNKHEVIEVSENLYYLKKKYHISNEYIFKINC